MTKFWYEASYLFDQSQKKNNQNPNPSTIDSPPPTKKKRKKKGRLDISIFSFWPAAHSLIFRTLLSLNEWVELVH